MMTILATLLGVCMSIAYFPQAYKIYKNRSSKDISLLSYGIFALGTVVWLIYGFLLQDLPIMISFGIGVLGSWTVLTLAIIYRKM
jgi:MtN3 and saliva related transmembrane protein